MEAQAELQVERKKFDRFLMRDRERLGYAKDMLNTRRMVQQSYANEVKRQQEKKRILRQKELEMSEAMALAQEEFRRVQRLGSRDNKRKPGSIEERKKRSVSKSSKQGDQYHAVKSRLFKSIESSR